MSRGVRDVLPVAALHVGLRGHLRGDGPLLHRSGSRRGLSAPSDGDSPEARLRRVELRRGHAGVPRRATSAPSDQTAIVPGSAGGGAGPTPPATPTPPAAPKPQAPLAPAATAAPTIAGLAMVEQTLTATLGSVERLAADRRARVASLRRRRDRTAPTSASAATRTRSIASTSARRSACRITASNLAGARDAVSEVTPLVSRAEADRAEAVHRRREGDRPAQARRRPGQGAPREAYERGAMRVTLRVSDDRGFRSRARSSRPRAPGHRAASRPPSATTTRRRPRHARLHARARSSSSRSGPRHARRDRAAPGRQAASPRGAIVRVKVAVGPAAKTISRR